MKKYQLLSLVILAFMFAACSTNEPENAFTGVWEYILPGGEKSTCDLFVITSDSIKAIDCQTQEEHYHAHYTFLRDSVIELERCWLKGVSPLYNAEAQMYFDEDKYLIISPFDFDIAQTARNYSKLKLKKHEEK